MDIDLEGRTVLVTGASGGIGRAVAEALGAERAHLILAAHANALGLREWVSAQPWAERARVLEADVRDPAAFEAALEGAAEGLAPLHGCVVNAGVWPPDDVPLVDLDEARIRDVIEINVLGAFWTARAFLRGLRTRGPAADGAGASLVFVGSTAAVFGERGHADYAASKAALAGLMRSLKNEIVALDPYGRANVVDPGWTVTEMTAANLDVPGVVERVVRTMPLQQLARPEDVANTILWLLSPAVARHVSGQVVQVAGGMEGRVLWEEGDVDAGRVRGRLRGGGG